MKDYLKGLAVLLAMFSFIATGTVVTSRPQQSLDIARATVRSVCASPFPAGLGTACERLARFRPVRPAVRS